MYFCNTPKIVTVLESAIANVIVTRANRLQVPSSLSLVNSENI